MTPIASICLSTHNKPLLLRNTLESIYRQKVPFSFETIVVDDGSKDAAVREICAEYPVVCHRIERPPVFRNPCTARNVAYRLAKGKVIIAQSDEVLHITENATERLVMELKPGHFLLANVFCLSPKGIVCGEYTGPGRLAPYFFLGSMWREDLYAVGGNDEDFRVSPACEDTWFGECLIYGRRLIPTFSTTITGHHQWHTYVSKPETEGPAREVLRKKHLAATKGLGKWESSGGPWPYTEELDMESQEIFERIYNTRAFYDKASGGTDESVSGAGSSLDATRAIREALPSVIQDYAIKTFFDLCCGDCNWIAHVNLGVDLYLGADIVPELIEENKKRYGRLGTEFMHLDLIMSPLPRADLILCRDCLVHLSTEDAKRAIRNLVSSGSKYLLATTFPERTNNLVISNGQWSPYNMQAPPFNFPTPLKIINEDCREHYPNFKDKSLGLWRIEDLIPCCL